MADEAKQGEGARDAEKRRGSCVVLSPPGSALLGVLLPALSCRWESLAVVSDEPAVMEQLAGGGVSVVVVVEPGAWGHLRALAAAMGRYFGRVLCMKFEVEPGETEPRITSLALRWMEAGGPSASGPFREAPGAGAASSIEGAPTGVSAGSGGDDMLAGMAEAGASRAAVSAELDADEALLRPRRKVDRLAVSAKPGESARAGEAGGTEGSGGASRVGPPEPLVTEEELSMLLGPALARGNE